MWLYTQIIFITCLEVEHNVANEELNLSERKSNKTTANTVDILCSSDKLIVRGHNVSISVVLNATCLDKVKFVEVFALHYLFIDADIDKTGANIQLSLIAPTWEIVGERKIIVDGEAGGEYYPSYASDGMGSFRNGKPGNPGEWNIIMKNECILLLICFPRWFSWSVIWCWKSFH